ncbi:FAD-binding oxidoreductase [Alsobacter metallidurans]|uniref:FAD-binding oxidoreductase n=1 Tax=Alsobacter metallidurans TaxID=340221 RepID=A0A917I602_9HYPH|nr:FAD-binding oxidoreductase [Alsobacter metallidurans]GGH16501.1 FAD-binding oxidoreductase [Alsobacter metallidurans]
MSARLAVDVCIIGGGIAGCASAVALRKAGLTAAVLDRGLCGAGASGVNFGGVRQQGRNLHELPLARRSRRIWDSLAAILEQDVEFDVSGHIKLARSEADLAELETYARNARDYGLDLQMLGANRVRSEIPWLGDKVIGASLSPEDGQANPRVVGPAFARLARRLGAEIHEHRRVTAARRTETGFEVEAGDLTVASAWLVNTAGVFGGTVAGWFGEHAPVEALMPNMLVTEPLPYFVSRSIGVCGGDVYLRQTGRGNVIFGGGRGWGDAEIARSRPLADESLGGMSRTLDLVPALTNAQVIRTWTGIDGQTPDRIPVIGHSSTTPQLVHAFGFSGHGFQLGPVMGEIIAELVTQGRTPTPIAPFSIERFAAGGVASSVEAHTHTEH